MTNMFEASHYEVLKWFQLNYPDLCREMRDSHHNFSDEDVNPYHAENDVWSHTMMVFKNSEFFSEGNHHVKWAALLHDLGKPGAREVVEDRKRVRFTGHSGLSAFMAVDVLNKAGLEAEDALLVFKLISMHGELFNYITADGEIKEKVKEVFAHDRDFLRHLTHLVRADSLGRFHSDGNFSYRKVMKDLPEKMEEFFSDVAEHGETVETETEGKLTVLVGPPCSGKSTWLRENVSPGSAVVISRDELVIIAGRKRNMDYNEAWKFFQRNRKLAQEEVDGVLTKNVQAARLAGKDVVIDMTNMVKKIRRRWKHEFAKYDRRIVVFVVGVSDLKQRCDSRFEATGKFLPEAAVLRMCMNFSLPLKSEDYSDIEYVWAKD